MQKTFGSIQGWGSKNKKKDSKIFIWLLKFANNIYLKQI
jgi:hypothetical protein